MKRTALALTLTLALLLSTSAATLLVHVTTANPFMLSGSWSSEPVPPSISVQSPSGMLNYWNESDVWLDFTVTVPLTSWYINGSFANPNHSATTLGTVTQVRFSVDGQPENNANQISEYSGVLSFSVNLGRLSVGRHAILISAEGSGYYGTLTHDVYTGSHYTLQESGAKTKLVNSSASIDFIVDGVRPTTPPKISILSPRNTTYYYIMNWTHIPIALVYKADDTRLSIEYSLDGDSKITPAKNGTTINVPIESRAVTIYANDSFGNSATPQIVQYEILPYVDSTSSFGPRSPPQSILQSISMPVEYVNYTISMVNGSLWAMVDGAFPMHIPLDWVGQEIPMLYPTPQGVTNISIELDGQKVTYSNYTQGYPDLRHYTYLGDWSMILCTIKPASPEFLMAIHYQHPISQANGTYMFLYDLNISPYLSDSSTESTAHFNIQFQTGYSNINIYTVPGDSSISRDNTKTPIDFTINMESGVQTVTFNITSDRFKPNLGDILITFQNSQPQIPEFTLWVILTLLIIIVAVAGLLVYFKKRKRGQLT